MALGQCCWPASHEDLDGDIWGGPAPWHQLFSRAGEAEATPAQAGIATFALGHTPSGGLTQALDPGSHRRRSGCSCPPQVLLH